MQVKLDELIHVMKGAQNALLDLEELEEDELDRIRAGYQRIAEQARGELRKTLKKVMAPSDLSTKSLGP